MTLEKQSVLEKLPIPEDIFVSLQVIWVFSLLYFIYWHCTLINHSLHVSVSLLLTQLYPASLKCNVNFKSSCPVPRGMANKNVNFFCHIHSFGAYKSYSAILNFQHPDKSCQFGKIQNSALINVFFWSSELITICSTLGWLCWPGSGWAWYHDFLGGFRQIIFVIYSFCEAFIAE